MAFAEEMYYRGLVQGGAESALGALLPPSPAAALALIAASALFGAAHVPWVARGADSSADSVGNGADSAGGGFGSGSAGGSAGEWFLETGAWGVVFGCVFLGSGHRLLAPIAAHAAQNVWYGLEDASAMARAPPTALAELFDGNP